MFVHFTTSATECKVRDAGEEDETIYIRSSMEEEEEEEEEDKAFLETCIEASCTPTRSPRQIDKKPFITLP